MQFLSKRIFSLYSQIRIIIHIDNEHKIEVGNSFWSAFQAITTYNVITGEQEVEGDPPVEVDDDENLPEEETIAVGGEKMWTTETILKLINEVKDRKFEFENTMKKFVWIKIALTLSSQCNREFSAKNCETKWKSLKRTYKVVLEHNNSNGKNKRQWEFFTSMHDILFTKPEINPPATCSSYTGLNIRQPEPTSRSSTPSSTHSETDFQVHRKRKANAAEDRHKNKMARQDKFLALFEKLVDKL
ncbi:hypothetical protein ILUMI_20395 [Ignelater luminosus]|uniref:Myb/SANT-like DNA-binding domain-containing protein n=1 Tax=Ignelater luminosus TaxID=2038154 RepID=A0A8K0CKY1_IGNLU|nr:hypothetical protein ILUMI_20395 [Ignelater luminosus]